MCIRDFYDLSVTKRNAISVEFSQEKKLRFIHIKTTPAVCPSNLKIKRKGLLGVGHKSVR